MRGLLLIVSVICFSLLGTAQAQDKLIIATEGAYPPFNNTTADGQLVGFDVDIAKALCKAMKRDCKIVAQDWDGIIPGLVEKKYDAIIASMSITAERLKTIDFTTPYYSNYITMVAKQGVSYSHDELASKTLGAQRATISSKWAEENFGRRGKIKLYDTQTAAYADFQAGRIDVLVSDYFPALDWVKKTPGFALMGEKIDIDDKIGIGLRKGEGALRKDLNTAIEIIRANGDYMAISKKYFGVDIY